MCVCQQKVSSPNCCSYIKFIRLSHSRISDVIILNSNNLRYIRLCYAQSKVNGRRSTVKVREMSMLPYFKVREKTCNLDTNYDESLVRVSHLKVTG